MKNNANRAASTNGQGAFIEGTGCFPGYAWSSASTYHITKRAEVFARLVTCLTGNMPPRILTTNSFTRTALSRLTERLDDENAYHRTAAGNLAGVRVRLD